MPLIDDEEETETTPGADIPVGDGDENEEEEVAENMNLPPVALVVEDGTGLSDANSYADLDFALEYCVSKGYSDWLELSDDEQKIHLIRGTEFVDNFYEWKGQRSSAYQAMAFPRRNVVDGDGFSVQGIPARLKKACIEAAFLSSSGTATTLFSQRDSNGAIKRKRIDVIEKEYFENSSASVSGDGSGTDYTSIYDILNKLLKGLYRTKDETCGINRRVIWQF